MNFDFDINEILPYEITVFDSDLYILNKLSEDDRRVVLTRDLRSKLAYMIDKIGQASANAQGLKDVITTYKKLQINSSHKVYLMKDENGNNGKGSLVGLLKVGKKHLFIFDPQGKHHEMNPTCILDFYVHTNQQRKGYGKRMFDYMLRLEQVQPKHLAIDTPSEKSIRFLTKYYNLTNPIPQVNNYVIFGGFFDDRYDLGRPNRRIQTTVNEFASKNTNNIQLFKNLPRLSSPVETKKQVTFYNNVADKDSSEKEQQKTNIQIKTIKDFTDPLRVVSEQTQYIQHQPQQSAMQYRPLNNQTNVHFMNKLSSAPVLSAPDHWKKLDTNTTNFTAANTFKSKPTPTSFLQETEQDRMMTNLLYNKYDPFPSLNQLKKPSYVPTQIETQTTTTMHRNYSTSDAYRIPLHKQNTYNALTNKYSAFPSLNNYSGTNSDLLSNPLYLDKFRKTRLW